MAEVSDDGVSFEKGGYEAMSNVTNGISLYGVGNMTATGAAALDEVPPLRPDLPGQNVEAVRAAVAARLRQGVADLNREMKDAQTCGLEVSVFQSQFLGGVVHVSIYETRKY